ncbi:MAG TPA: DUF72 domain-containing protein [Nitrososphaeraceae archaeon]|nr:DUF72 domain-containing protein [Nitrososphaeraceae archaeon]
MKFYIGCCGWSYTAWKGPFYPSDIKNSKWLEFYSKVFDYVEIDSSFYNKPNVIMVKQWLKKTQEDFRFTAKFPKVITHDKRLKNVDNELQLFFKAIEPLYDKTLALLIQLPPSIEIMEGLQRLRELVYKLDNRFRYAVEVRHQSWFQDLAYNFFANNNICMVWSQIVGIRTPPIVTSDFLYLRFIGDRSLQEKDFGRIQKDRSPEMRKWVKRINRAEKSNEEENKRLKFAIVAANNHYAGFGPMSVNIFRKMIGLKEVTWDQKDKVQQQEISNSNSNTCDLKNKKKTQRTLTDFLQ